jgi:hypothetical protein
MVSVVANVDWLYCHHCQKMAPMTFERIILSRDEAPMREWRCTCGGLIHVPRPNVWPARRRAG